jgi:hypothetical protein
LVLVLVLSVAALSASRLATKSTLDLPATHYRYASVELPAHFQATAEKLSASPGLPARVMSTPVNFWDQISDQGQQRFFADS